MINLHIHTHIYWYLLLFCLFTTKRQLKYSFFYNKIGMQPQNKKKYIKKKGVTKPEYLNLNAFKKQQKHYKLYHGQVTDYSHLFEPKQEDCYIVDGYKIWQLPFPQGAFYVPNFNSQDTVLQIGKLGLNIYCNKPYRTNLDSREDLYKQEYAQKQATQQSQIKKQSINEQNQEQQLKNKGYYFDDKIRWANVGYQYDWTLRKYPDKKTPIHQSIRDLSDRANCLFNKFKNTNFNYEPESAIINFYGTKDYMTGHLDDAQIDQQSPIYSFSFGLSCVFLIGGRNKDEKPTAIRLNSGDLLIMSAQSRKCYHGVPRVISQTFENHLLQSQPEKDEIQWINQSKQIYNYFQSHRININIRQVFPEKQDIK